MLPHIHWCKAHTHTWWRTLTQANDFHLPFLDCSTWVLIRPSQEATLIHQVKCNTAIIVYIHNTFHSIWKEYIFQSPIITWRPSEVILQPPWGLPTLSLGITDMENKKIHYYFTPLTFTSSFFSPVLQRYSVVTQLHLLMAVFPVWMAQLSPTPLCIHVWRDICSPAHPHASVWQMAHGLARLQTAQVSLVYTETWRDIGVMSLGLVENT